MLTLILLGMAAAYLLVVMVVIYFISKIVQRPRWRWLFRMILFVIFMFLPVADQVIGRFYFDHLCETESGVHIYETVELAPKYYNSNGTPRFMDKKGRFDSSVFNGKYIFEVRDINDIANFVVIEKTIHTIKNTITGKVLGTYVWFFYRGGWINNNFSHHRGGIACVLVKGGYYEVFIKKILKSTLTK